MKQIEKDHWYVTDNKMGISLMWFYVDIKLPSKDDPYYHLTVTDRNMEEEEYKFNTLEEAISFTENVVDTSFIPEQIKESYEKMYVLKNKEVKEIIDNKLFLTPGEIEGAIIDYYGDNNFNTSAKYSLGLNNNKPEVTFYRVEHLKSKDREEFIDIRLDNKDLMNVFNRYLEDTDYEVDNFKYAGGVHMHGLFIEENTPVFEGIELNLKEKEKNKTLSKRKQ